MNLRHLQLPPSQRQNAFPPKADQPQAETSFAAEGLLLAHDFPFNCGIRVKYQIASRII